ncbi:hypothetical protein ANO11243_034740 [Dothideomycetidae sp. 11243]|nr:hypothetical protein ANO11243_034740 [fungal sp. No.11243]
MHLPIISALALACILLSPSASAQIDITQQAASPFTGVGLCTAVTAATSGEFFGAGNASFLGQCTLGSAQVTGFGNDNTPANWWYTATYSIGGGVANLFTTCEPISGRVVDDADAGGWALEDSASTLLLSTQVTTTGASTVTLVGGVYTGAATSVFDHFLSAATTMTSTSSTPGVPSTASGSNIAIVTSSFTTTSSASIASTTASDTSRMSSSTSSSMIATTTHSSSASGQDVVPVPLYAMGIFVVAWGFI